MINEAAEKLSNVSRDFGAIYQRTLTFVVGVNVKLPEEDICLTTDLPEVRANRKAPRVQSAEKNFEVRCYNVTFDTAILSNNN